MTNETATFAAPSADLVEQVRAAIPTNNIRDTHERRIIGRAVAFGLAQGWSVSVNDGVCWCLKMSRDIGEIAGSLASTDCDIIRFRDDARQSMGSIILIYGNGEDVLSDHTDNEAMEALFNFAALGR